MKIDDVTLIYSDFLAFVRYMSPQIVTAEYHYRIAAALERVVIGKCKRLIINIPPRAGKSELAVVHFIAWCLGFAPYSKFIVASYGKSVAQTNTYKARELMQHGRYRTIYGDRLKIDSRAKAEFRTPQGGFVYAAGVGGAITGHGAGGALKSFGGAFIIDDAHNATESNSETMLANVIDWYNVTVKSRLNSMEHTPIIVIMQRLHEYDLAGYLLNGGSGEEWESIIIPAINEDGTSYCEERHPIKELHLLRDSNAMTFAGQYMQSPRIAGGNIFKADWFGVHQYVAPFYGFDSIVHSWDTAYKADQHNDPSCCTVWGIKGNQACLLDMVNVRMEYPQLKRKVHELADIYPPQNLLIEDKASGQTLIQELRNETRLPVIAINPEGDKMTRAVTSCGMVEAGRVMLPLTAWWLSDYIKQMTTFPNDKHDDMVDSTSQFINWFKANDKNTMFEQQMKELRNAKRSWKV
jgi:predicted phage terminase large subunit-like protein